MKKFLFFLFAGAIAFTACNKLDDVSPVEDQQVNELDVSKSLEIKRGEPVYFKFANIPETSEVAWKVAPEDGTQLNATGSVALATFSNAGNYQISGMYQNVVLKATVHVNDSVYIPPAQDGTTPLLVDETITVRVMIHDSSFVGKPEKIRIEFEMTTANKYACLNNNLSLVHKSDSLIIINGVFKPDDRFCTAGEKEATSRFSVVPEPLSSQFNIPRKQLEIQMNGKSYKGHYGITNGEFYVIWPYAEGVVFDAELVFDDDDNVDPQDFDLKNPNVDMFVKLLKEEKYKITREPDGEDQTLVLAMPEFKFWHIPALLEYADDTTAIRYFPTNPHAKGKPFPEGRDHFVLAEALLWIVEGIRTSNLSSMPVYPFLYDISKTEGEWQKGLSNQEIIKVGRYYINHINEVMKNSVIEWWYDSQWSKNPLEGTNYRWAVEPTYDI